MCELTAPLLRFLGSRRNFLTRALTHLSVLPGQVLPGASLHTATSAMQGPVLAPVLNLL